MASKLREDICDMSVGKAIARYRKKKAMTQMDLASAMNVHQSQIARWETGRSFPRKEYLEELSDALDVSVEQLFHSEPHDFGRLDDDEPHHRSLPPTAADRPADRPLPERTMIGEVYIFIKSTVSPTVEIFPRVKLLEPTC